MPAFWILNASGWLAYAGLSAVFSFTEKRTGIPQIFLFLLPFIAGFLVCIPMRFFYKKIRFHERQIKYSLPLAIAVSFVGANVWLGLIIVVTLA